ncbi:hypothetical protein C8J56DRAFT_295687 [Mycena floridula]|nr:hypothetical protein C8J56DRAFT_295687 [Mycena floridula]
MDELLHHIHREIAFDGNLGCQASSFRRFVVDFYTDNLLQSQNTDDAFCSFVWSLVVRRPTVRVGTVPDGVSSDIWVAPQTSAKRKALLAGQEHVSEAPPELALIPDAKSRSLDDLIAEYGDSLRIGLDSDAIYAIITGSHIRYPKMSPMVYSALQIITRGRDNGVSVVEIGQKSGYDQKACFYLVRQLTELDLAVKVRRGGMGTHIIIHRYFFDRSPAWKEIRDEETKAEDVISKKEPQEDEEQPSSEAFVVEPLQFTRIDVRHLSSLPLLRGRIIRLLKASRNQLHPSHDILLKIGCLNPSKPVRRFFQTQLREMIDEGIIEKVIVAAASKNKRGGISCIRLIDENGSTVPAEKQAVPVDEDVEKNDFSDYGLKMNATLHKQITDLLESAGPTGMTLSELSTNLCEFDRRTLELLLMRAERDPPPSHLADLQVAGIMESCGRERRHRYFTVAAYQTLVEQEHLDKEAAGFATDIDVSGAGGFLAVESKMFYETEEALEAYENSFRVSAPSKLNADGTTKRGRPRNDGPRKRKEQEGEGPPRSRKRRKIEDDGEPKEPKKRGRPRKIGSESEINSPPKKRGRPSKVKVEPKTEVVPKKPTLSVKVAKAKKPATPSKRATKARPALKSPMPEDDEDKEEAVGDPDPVPQTEEAQPMEVVEEGANLAQSEEMDVDQTASTLVASAFQSAMDIEETSLGVVSKKPLKKPKAYSLPRVNVSNLRRENEACRVIEGFGGIVNLQCRDFYEGHIALLDELARTGEPASGPPGTRIDKRTATFTFKALEEKGRLKQLRTTVATPSGPSRSLNIVYLPEVADEQLSQFLAGLGRSVHNGPPPQASSSGPRKIDEQLEYGPLPTGFEGQEPSLRVLKFSKAPDEVESLFACDDESIRQNLLTERTTMCQMYGTIVAKCLRMRKIHLTALGALELSNLSSTVISREKRIIHISLLCLDLPLFLYLGLVPPTSHHESIVRYLATEAGRVTLVKDLPAELHETLQIGRARSRSRILDLLDKLRMLHLVVPLQPAASENPFVTCAPNGVYPTSFDVAFHESPVYWMFTSIAPVHLWAPRKSESETTPPFWKQVPVVSSGDASEYWDLLHKSCTDPNLTVPPIVEDNHLDLVTPTPTLGRVLRRASCWSARYVFSWHQIQYLKRFIDNTSRTTPLDQGDECKAQIDKICWVLSAPSEAVREYYLSFHARIQRETEKASRRHRKSKEERAVVEAEKARSTLARRAAEAKRQKERDWDDLVSRIHPDELSRVAKNRLKIVRERFMESIFCADAQRWQSEIIQTLKEAKEASKKVLKMSKKPLTAPKSTSALAAPPTIVTIAPEHSIAELIELQGPSIAETRKKRKWKDEQDAEETADRNRRSRFQWNKEYDELVRDASAIIKARCRDAKRLDWGAFEQIFPSVPRNSVRQRLGSLRNTPESDAYLNRLEDRWYELWKEHRGSLLLPDPNPTSATEFDLVHHLEFLRKHVDKDAIRVGYSTAREMSRITLPAMVLELFEQFDVVEPVLMAPKYDYIWNTVVEEGREKKLLSSAFTRYPEPMIDTSEPQTDLIRVAETSLKMVLGTPNEAYDPEVASKILKNIGQNLVNVATRNLLTRGVLSQLVRDPKKQKPGRQLKISEPNQSALGGIVNRDLFQDATALEDISVEGEWREWPLLASDGDLAALIQLVSEEKVTFKVDTTQAQAARPSLDWNSKKADDDNIETAIFVRFQNLENARPMSEPVPMEVDTPRPVSLTGHGRTVDSTPACCKKVVDGVTDCSACLDEQWSATCSEMTAEDMTIAQQVLWLVGQAREKGATKKKLVATIKQPMEILLPIIQRLVDAPIPLLTWLGYSSPLSLVSASHIRAWTALISEDIGARVFPRRWLDISGYRISEIWEAGLRAVVGAIVFRPGINQAELRWRLRSVYDRHEADDLLRHLYEEGVITMVCKAEDISAVLALDEEDEMEVYWFLGEKHWYQTS